MPPSDDLRPTLHATASATLVALLTVVWLPGCAAPSEPSPTSSADVSGADRASELAAGVPRFVDVTAELGLDFTHRGGESGDYLMPAIMRGGGAVFDANGDGRLDLYLTNSGNALPTAAEPRSEANRLFLQEEDGTFSDATAASGLGDSGYGMGCAVGDIDNDGDLDLYVTNYGADRLYRNDGAGKFSDVTRASGLGDDGWSSSAMFFDYDRDGWLDLYVVRYVDFDRNRRCSDESGRREFCGPTEFSGVADLLYRNLGQGRFEDRSRASGLAAVREAGLGLAIADYDGNGWLDVYVTNDADPNNLWMNQGDGTFLDDAVMLGSAYNLHGQSEAGMGVSAGDVDGDGDIDLFMTHLIDESNTFYENLGELGFEDSTARAGLGVSSLNYTGWGTAFFDVDNDGDLDVGVTNGGSKRRPSPMPGQAKTFWSEYTEPDFLYRNRGDGSFDDVSQHSGDYGARLDVGRGLIPFDLEGDGDLDLLVLNTGGAARLFRNQLVSEGATGGSGWLAVRVLDPKLQRDALGATVVALTHAGRLTRLVQPVAGYQTSGQLPLHFGLGQETEVTGFEVTWLDGEREQFPGAQTGRLIELRRGAGTPMGSGS